MCLQRAKLSLPFPLHRVFSPQWTFPMGARLPPHRAAVQGRTQNFAGFMATKNFVANFISPGQMEQEGGYLPESHSGKQAAGVAAGGRLLRHRAQFPHTVRCSGEHRSRRDRGNDRNGRCGNQVFTHPDRATAKPASGFRRRQQGVRQQLPPS